MPLTFILILAVIQGIGEFLPISSSGHLTIVQTMLASNGQGLAEMVALNVALHLGTLGSILVIYWERIARLLSEDGRVLPLVFVGSLPAAGVGLLLKPHLEQALGSALLAGAMLPITGLMLLVSSRLPAGETDYRNMSWQQALVVGLFQAFALLPGISRSGSTIAAGIGVGLKRDSAATFSFLLAIPAIIGAGILESRHLVASSQLQAWPLALGATTAFVVGVVALKWLLAWLNRGKLSWFAWWCIPFGLAVVVWQLSSRA